MVFKTRSCRWWRGRGLVDVFGLSYLDSSVRIALPGVFQQSSVAVLAGVVVGGVGLDPHRRRAIGWVLGFLVLLLAPRESHRQDFFQGPTQSYKMPFSWLCSLSCSSMTSRGNETHLMVGWCLLWVPSAPFWSCTWC